MKTAKLFNLGRTQAVRLPKEFKFDEDEVFITKVDEMVILYPRRKGWDLFAKSLQYFTDDFMSERDQPTGQDSENQDAKAQRRNRESLK